MDTQVITTYLADLGLDEQSARIFTTLTAHGPLGIAQLARESKVERTKIYRIINKLLESGIVEEQVEYKRRYFKAADTNSIQRIVEDKRRQASSLSDAFESFSSSVKELSQHKSTTSVKFYKGKEGIKQMLWNELKAKSESLCFIYKVFDTFVGSTFFDHWAEEFALRNLSSKEIRTEIFEKSFQDKPNDICYIMPNISIRYIPRSEMPLTHGLTIYDDVVAIYDFWDGEISGIEIQNKRIADMQRVFFETYWKLAKPDPAKRYVKKIVRTY